ncbi:hypothetical protein AM596_15805 [Clostridium perfringens CP4]|uniref:hypothetical protein n=1 Tax=Clostridium perfringens TaxID=1502 RepID=UPI0007075A73|nr:hypothetical protein [Clostridium perfringens]KQC91221.1 hypothetical protein AM596_15805 [Clostridium perfringens CP4]
MNKLKLTRNILTSALLIIIGIIIGILISNHMHVKANTKPTVAIQQEQSNNQPVRLTKVLTQSTEDIKLDKNEIYRELSDNSYSLENDSTKEFSFQPSIMGDWDIAASSKEELDNIILTYIENTNNLNKTVKKPLRITKVLTNSTEDVRISKDEIYTEYSTNAWTIEDNKNNKYELSIPELGDYTYIFNNRKDFDNCLQTYIDNYNNGENLSI